MIQFSPQRILVEFLMIHFALSIKEERHEYINLSRLDQVLLLVLRNSVQTFPYQRVDATVRSHNKAKPVFVVFESFE